jgi:hypothetical protein
MLMAEDLSKYKWQPVLRGLRLTGAWSKAIFPVLSQESVDSADDEDFEARVKPFSH